MKESSPQFAYSYPEGPTRTPPDKFLERLKNSTEEDVLPLNCQLFVSTTTRALGMYLPDYYRSSEILEDPEKCLKEINLDSAGDGDIAGFSRESYSEAKRIHIGVLRRNEQNELEVVHATKESKTVEVTSFSRIFDRPKYRTLRFIKRPTQFLPDEFNPLALQKLGFLPRQIIRNPLSHSPS
jgi:hypothetical protein